MSESNLVAVEKPARGRPRRGRAAPSTSIGVCLDAEHPTLRGRARIRWRDGNREKREAWVPQLRGLTLNRGDRVLLSHPRNHDEPVVIGVLDGLGRRPPRPAEDGPIVRLQPHEALRVAAPDGTPLLEITASEAGPAIRLLAPAAGIDMPGALRIRADDIELEARTGEVRVNAAGDVKVAGEVVRLN